MSTYALGGRAGWHAADVSDIEVRGALHTRGSGAFRSEALDSRLPGCHWDRLRFDVALPPGTSVAFSTYAADADRGDLAMAALDDAEWSSWATVAGPFDGISDVLVRARPGRYLWIRIALNGTTTAPAAVHFVDATYPRSTSLRMLPAVYSTDAGGRDLNERLLALFDAMHDGVKDEIRLLASVIDPHTTDASAKRDFLDWLGTWFGLEVFRAWPERRRRAVIAHAGELFRRRGTKLGIRQFVELALGREIGIVEGWVDRHWWFAAEQRLGCAVLYGPEVAASAEAEASRSVTYPRSVVEPFAARANRMTVVVPYTGARTVDEITWLRTVVEVQKPAHVAVCFVFVEPDLRLGVNARLGFDAVIGMLRPPAVLAGHAPPRLGVNATVGDRL